MDIQIRRLIWKKYSLQPYTADITKPSSYNTWGLHKLTCSTYDLFEWIHEHFRTMSIASAGAIVTERDILLLLLSP